MQRQAETIIIDDVEWVVIETEETAIVPARRPLQIVLPEPAQDQARQIRCLTRALYDAEARAHDAEIRAKVMERRALRAVEEKNRVQAREQELEYQLAQRGQTAWTFCGSPFEYSQHGVVDAPAPPAQPWCVASRNNCISGSNPVMLTRDITGDGSDVRSDAPRGVNIARSLR